MPVELQPIDQESMVRSAVAHLTQQFEAIDEDQIDATVRPWVDELCGRARVKTFVGIIAERHARDALRRRPENRTAVRL